MNENTNICPVPNDQRPINEYLSLKESFGFSWTTNNELNYYKTSLKIYFLVFLAFIVCFFSADFLSPIALSYSILFVSIILFVFHLRIYLGWNYIYTRLMKATVAYEESGWYDGQVWVKTPEALIKDKLAGQYQVLPILKRVKLTLIILLTLIFSSFYFISFLH